MTQFVPTRQLRFYMTSVAPCPYLPGQTERKVFANLPFSEGAHVNDELTQAGFRRSQNIAYRPACEGCDACVSVRLPVPEFRFSRSERKVLKRNADLTRDLVEAEATMEQFDLLRRYLHGRHPGGGDGVQRAPLVRGVALHGLDEVGDQILPLLQLHVDVGERLVGPLIQRDEFVVAPDDEKQHDGDDDGDDDQGGQHGSLQPRSTIDR